ncbi:MAG: hypothetical protein U1F98_02205 [Verrucomicrobiota bacterium]
MAENVAEGQGDGDLVAVRAGSEELRRSAAEFAEGDFDAAEESWLRTFSSGMETVASPTSV